MTEQRAQEPVREAREHTCRSQGENIRENMSMQKRRAQEPVPEVREKTCRSQGDTAAGGAGELKRSNPSPLLGAANVGESERSLLHWELPGEAQLVLCS